MKARTPAFRRVVLSAQRPAALILLGVAAVLQFETRDAPYPVLSSLLVVNALLLLIGSIDGSSHTRPTSSFAILLVQFFSSTTLNYLPLGISIVEFTIAGEALFKFEQASFWTGALMIPAILSYLQFRLMSKTDSEENTETNVTWDTETGKTDRSSVIIRTSFWVGILGIVGLAPLVLVGLAGVAVYIALRAEIFLGRAMSVGHFIGTVEAVAQKISSVFLPMLVLVPCAILVSGVFYAVSQAFLRARYRTYDRLLSVAELAFLDQSDATLKQLLARRHNPRIIGAITFVLVLVLLFGFIVGAVSVEGFIVERLATYRTPAQGWSLYVDPSGAWMIAAFFAWVMICWSAWQLAATAWPILGEYRVAYAGETKQEGALRNLRDRLVHAVRARRVDTGKPFDPHAFCRERTRGWGRPVYVATAAIVLVSAFVIYRDLARYDLFTPDGLAYVDWSFQHKKIRYSDLKKVVTFCGGPAKGELLLQYEIVGDGHTVDLRGPYKFEKRLDALEQIDRSLVAAKVKFETAHDDRCLPLLMKRFDMRNAGRVIRLLHLEVDFPPKEDESGAERLSG
jgi:hypothetical protein